MSKPVVGYWDIRGLAEPIRLIYHYLGIDFEDKRYQYVSGPNPKELWHNERLNYGLDFPNLPYVLDGDVKLTQSNAILRYLGRKFNLGGEAEVDKQRVDLLEQQLSDLKKNMIMVCYLAPDFEKARKEYLVKLQQELELLSKFLGSRQYVTGDKITYADFMLYDYLDMQRLFEPSSLDRFDNLKHFLARVEALPTVAKYIRSDKFPRNRCWGKTAKWSGPQV